MRGPLPSRGPRRRSRRPGTAVTLCSRDTRCASAYGGCGLEQREHGPAEQSSLLPGDDRDRSGVRQPSCGGDGFARRAPPLLLRNHDVGDLASRTRVALCGGDGRPPGRGVGGIAREERCDAREVERIVHCQAPHPRQAAHVDREPHGAVGRRGRLCVHEEGTLANALRACQDETWRVGGGHAACYDRVASRGVTTDD